MENNITKKKLNIIDVLIIALLLLCIVGIALRFLLVKATPDPDTIPDVEAKKYRVSYIIRNQRHSLRDYLTENEEFRFYYTNKPFGISEGTSNTSIGHDIRNAQKRYTTSYGDDVIVYNTADDDRIARYDIWGSFEVEGKLTDDGYLIINESAKESIGLNKDILLRSDKAVIRIYVSDITPIE